MNINFIRYPLNYPLFFFYKGCKSDTQSAIINVVNTKSEKEYFLLSTPLVSLAIYALICSISACLGSIFASGSLPQMYFGLKKPIWSIPQPALLPVWIALHVIITLGVWQHQQQRRKDNGVAHACFMLHYLCLLLWPYIYFEKMRPAASLIFAAFLWATASLWIFAGRKVSRFSTIILLPYWLFTLYLMLLNLILIRMNPGIFATISK